jgi:hypothetical protein
LPSRRQANADLSVDFDLDKAADYNRTGSVEGEANAEKVGRRDK